MSSESQAIRDYCVEMCRFGDSYDVDNCDVKNCPLWEHRGVSVEKKGRYESYVSATVKLKNRRPFLDISDEEMLAIMEMELDDIKIPPLSKNALEGRIKRMSKRKPLPHWSSRTERYIWGGVWRKPQEDGSWLYASTLDYREKGAKKNRFVWDTDEVYVAYTRDKLIRLIFPEEEWPTFLFNNIEMHYPDRIPEYEKKFEEFLQNDRHMYRIKRYKLRIRKERLLDYAKSLNEDWWAFEPMWYINYETNMLVYGGPEEFKEKIEERVNKSVWYV